MAVKSFDGILTIDPITRIEGHLKLQTEVKNGIVTKAWSSAQLFRGIESIVQGRSPENVHNYVQRVCGVCTNTHALASIRAVEAAIGLEITPAAALVRDMILTTQMIADHLIHFYLLNGLDFIDLQSALSADPKASAKLASENGGVDISADAIVKYQNQLKGFVASGQLGFLANADFLGGNPCYKLSPEENMVVTRNYLECIRVQVKLARANAIFTSKNPHAQTMRVGGVTCYDALKPESLDMVASLLKECKDFIYKNYKNDVYLLSQRYPDVCAYGGTENFYDVPEFYPVTDKGRDRDGEPFFKGGVLWGMSVPTPGQAADRIEKADYSKITEDTARSWYEEGKPMPPFDGITNPKYSEYDREKEYSWSKAPRYDGKAVETGPLARRMIAYALGNESDVKLVNEWLSECKLPAQGLNSTMGRIASRMMETLQLMDKAPLLLEELRDRAKSPTVAIYKDWKMPQSGEGVGFVSVPRGALSHWIRIEKGITANYQMVVPSTWNMGPRCANDLPSAVEQSLVGVPVPDPDRPTDIVRTVRSLDPCIACAVHVMHGKPVRIC